MWNSISLTSFILIHQKNNFEFMLLAKFLHYAINSKPWQNIFGFENDFCSQYVLTFQYVLCVHMDERIIIMIFFEGETRDECEWEQHGAEIILSVYNSMNVVGEWFSSFLAIWIHTNLTIGWGRKNQREEALLKSF
jgi:hypothetical protein